MGVTNEVLNVYQAVPAVAASPALWAWRAPIPEAEARA